jgi:hypothetical protein
MCGRPASRLTPRREGRGELSVEGDYLEVCNCDVSCNCVWLGLPPRTTAMSAPRECPGAEP